ncbi:MAG: LTA synthase family protein [Gammaproteobacteria bacterium]|nr:LTA synthase family protein [Gammaproteobacteria bacterium]NNJ78762.1 sulfatase-like hydrolase/transferase [Xanthomonadales bacterium]
MITAIQKLKALLAIYKRLAVLASLILVFLSLSRVLLVSAFWDRVSNTEGLGFILLQGVRFDIIFLGMILGPALLFRPWFHTLGFLRRVGAWVIPAYLGIALALGFFVEASTYSFIVQYDSRPNYLFVEYLAYPKEVLSMLAGSHLAELVIFTSLSVFIAVYSARWMGKDPAWSKRVPFWFCLLAAPLTLILLVGMIRSTLAHRPVNPSIAVFSQDSMVNQLPLNSPYSLLYAIYEHRKHASEKDHRYGEMEDEKVLSIILEEAGIEAEEQLDPDVPTLHHQRATRRLDRPLNLVVVLLESLGADTVGSLGGLDLTPELDEFADQGIWLERLYSTGTRSVRGIEAVISGFVPTPRVSVVKLPETQNNFFTLAGLLEKQGYETSFIYGGEAHFDNMKRFFLNNGFQTVIDQDQYEDPVYRGSWGVSDEDIFNRAHEAFSGSRDQPFFSVVFTTSNHEPFGIPENRVARESDPEGDRKTAIRYADYALGRFIEQARQSDYWDDTVFLIVADHPARLFAGKLVPVHRFHIPGVIIGKSIEPRRVSGITSQIDLFPTLLSLIGVDSDHPGIGRDMTLPQYANGTGRAMMQFNALQAFLEDDSVAVLQPDLPAQSFRLQADGKMVPIPEGDPELERKALAYASWGPMVIDKRSYPQ